MQITIKSVGPSSVEFAIDGYDDISKPGGEPNFALQLLLEPYAMMRDRVADELGIDDEEATRRLANLPQRSQLERLHALDHGDEVEVSRAELIAMKKARGPVGHSGSLATDERFRVLLPADDRGLCAEADRLIASCEYHDGTLLVTAREAFLVNYLEVGWSWESAAFVKPDPRQPSLAPEPSPPTPEPTGPAFRLTVVDRSEDRVRLRYAWDHGLSIANDPVAVWYLGIGALIDLRDDEPAWVTACRHVRGLAIKEATGAELDYFESVVERTGEGPAVVDFSLRVHDASVLDRLVLGSAHDVPLNAMHYGVWRLSGSEQGKVQDVSISLSDELVVSTSTAGGAPKAKKQKFSKSLDGALARARTVREHIDRGFRAAPDDV